MFKRRRIQAIALCLAAIVTASQLAGMDMLATQQHAASALAHTNTAQRAVAVTAPRAPRS